MRRLRSISILALALSLAGCGGNQASTSGSYDSPYNMGDTRSAKEREEAVTRATQALGEKPAQETTAGMNAFGIALLKKTYDEANMSVSPVSIAFALGMAQLGAGGDTRKQITDMLGTSKLPADQFVLAIKNLREVLRSADPKVQLAIANSIWTKQGFPIEPTYLQQNADVFAAKVTELDFTNPDAPKTINEWVSANTNKKIPTIVDKLTPESVMYLINAVYFKGFWRDPFDKKMTTKRPFHVAADKTTEADMMIKMGNYPYAKLNEAKYVALPFGNGRFQFVAVLPPEKGGLKGFVESLTPKIWSDAMAQMGTKMVDFSLPRFAIAWEGSLNETLQALGMKDAFTDRADFSGMRKEKDVFVTQVKHKTVVIVDEEGAEAAAATSIAIGTVSVQVPEVMHLDRPFLFAIRDAQTGAVLFMGTIQDPAQA